LEQSMNVGTIIRFMAFKHRPVFAGVLKNK